MAKAVDKLAAVTAIPEPADVKYPVDLSIWTYSFQGKTIYTWDFSDRVTDLRVNLDTTQASTVEIDLEDADFSVLDDPLFANWAFNIEDVSLSSAKKFKPTRLQNATSTAYLGDTAQLEWVMGQKPIDYAIGDVSFRLCGIHTQQTTVTLTFEDRVASFLRDQKGHKSWDRSQHTRAEFVAMLCREAGVDYWIPELMVGQPVEVTTNANGSVPTTPVGKSVASRAHLTVKGSPMTATQRSVASTICSVGAKLNAPPDAIIAVLFDAIYESTMGAGARSNGAYGGILGGSVSIFASDVSSAVPMATAAFKGGQGYTSAITLAGQKPGNIAWIGSQCTRPTPFDANGISTQYESQNVPGGISGTVKEATDIYLAFGGPSANAAQGSTSSSGSYAFTRGPNEDSWDCIQRLASEVAWYAFVRQNRLWFVSGNYLFSQAAQMSIERGQAGVDYIDLDLDLGARDQIAECIVAGRSGLWSALPGMVVEVLKRGPATGKWFVSSLTSQPLNVSDGVQITLQKPVPKRAEPAATSTTKAGQRPSAQSTAPGSVQAAITAAQNLDALHIPYVWGGGHVTGGASTDHPTGLDCSGSVSWVLYHAGFKLPSGGTAADVSGAFETWGAPGPGKNMTIWCNAGHIFIEFKTGSDHTQLNTSNNFNSGSGPRYGPWGGPGEADASSGTFVARHWPGT